VSADEPPWLNKGRQEATPPNRPPWEPDNQSDWSTYVDSETKEPPASWYLQTPVVIAALLLLGPLGLALVWLKRSWSTTAKTVLTLAFVALPIVVFAINSAVQHQPSLEDALRLSASSKTLAPGESSTSTTSSMTASTAPTPRSAVAPTSGTPAPTSPLPTQSTTGTLVVAVVDGDTLDVEGGIRIRLIGIDTPERGQCGYTSATEALAGMVEGRRVVLIAGARDDSDRYGRLLRYVEIDGRDVNLAMIQSGHAIARYDSLDGYGRHPRQDQYRAADAASSTAGGCDQPTTTQSPAQLPTAPVGGGGGAPDLYFANCGEAKRSGMAPLFVGQPGYRPGLDGDKDGVACE